MQRYLAIDGLRGLMAFYVAFYHLGLFYVPSLYTSWLGFRLGHYAVTVFIVISGFCLMYPIIRNEYQIKDGFFIFMQRRFWRLYPALVAALILVVVVAMSLNKAIHPFAIPANLLMLTDLHAIHPNNPLTVTWSLASEWHIYLLIPILLVMIRRWGWLISGIIACLIVALMFLFPSWLIAYVRCPYYFLAFFLGGVVAYLVQRYPSLPRHAAVIHIASGLSFLLFAFLVWRKYDQAHIDLFVALMSAIWVLQLTALPHSPVTRIFAMEPMHTLGVISYSLYLVHLPIFDIYFKCLSITLSPGLSVLVAMVVMIGGSWLFAHAVELPFLRMRDRFVIKRKASPSDSGRHLADATLPVRSHAE